MEKEIEEIGEGVYQLNAMGYSCPYPELLARKAVEEIGEDKEIHIMTDNKPSTEEIPMMAERKGHEVVEVEKIDNGTWKIKIKKQ